jgi:putative FmdB family regulatory protein
VPLYDYDCANCGRRFEVIHGVHADPPAACPLCGGGPVKKAIQAPAVHFKGSGWAKKERRATAAPGKAASSDGERTGDGAATKPAADTSAAADSGSAGGEGAERASSATVTPTDKAPAKTPSAASTDD